jgi:hypothetical protein
MWDIYYYYSFKTNINKNQHAWLITHHSSLTCHYQTRNPDQQWWVVAVEWSAGPTVTCRIGLAIDFCGKQQQSSSQSRRLVRLSV